MKDEIIFGICADVHQTKECDISWMMKKFVDEATERNADFIIQLGDFVRPDEAGQKLLDEWNKFKGPRYHVLGNHDTEHGGKELIMKFQGQEEKYYSFDCGNYHFIVLDTNYAKVGTKYIEYGSAEYDRSLFSCYVSEEQLEWLKKDIDSTDKRCFVFTHATLSVGNWTVYNMTKLRSVFWAANEKAGYNKVTMCFSGHDHADEYQFMGGIHYMIVNSMSHKYIGSVCANTNFSADEVKKEYGQLKDIIPYKDPLYAFVKLKKNGFIQIFGKQSEYVGHSPKEVHWEYYASPQIAYRELWMNGIGEL